MSTSEVDWYTAGPNISRPAGEEVGTTARIPISEAVRFVEEPEVMIHNNFIRESEFPPIWYEKSGGRRKSALKGRVALDGAMDGAYLFYDYQVNLPGDFGQAINRLVRREPNAHLSKTISLMVPMMKTFRDITPRDFGNPSSVDGTTLVD